MTLLFTSQDMKRLLTILLILPCFIITRAADSEIVKRGWSFGPLPVVGFDSDLGFQYGLCCDIYNFGDGTNYPQYDFKINVEASTYTKGSSVLRTYGDFKTLIPNGKLFFDVAYFNSPKYGFYGFNGYASEYDPNKIAWSSTAVPIANAKTGYNFMSRNQFRTIVSSSKQLSGPLSAAIGLAFYHITTDRLSLNEYEGQRTLFDEYMAASLIGYDEYKGGNVTQLRAGLLYDTRNHDSDPSRGLNIETSLVYSPDLIDRAGFSNLNWYFSLSHFVPVAGWERLTLAYRFMTQAKLWGEIPCYFTNNINSMFFRKMYTEGIGGNASVRGINRNSVLGEGFALFNAELRWRIYDFKFINQNWQIATNPFLDAGRTIQPYRLNQQKKAGLYSGNVESLHVAAGLGLKLIMNHNMVVSFEAGKAFNKNDGEALWTNIGFNYMF